MTLLPQQIDVINPMVIQSINGFKKIIAEETFCPVNFCDTTSRVRPLVKARQILCYVVKDIYPSLTTAQIGYLAGGKDHTTFLHAINAILNLMETDQYEKKLIEQILAQCKIFAGTMNNKISLLQMGIKVVEELITNGKFDVFMNDYYCIRIDNYIWNNDDTVSKIISKLITRGLNVKYQYIDSSKYVCIHFNNFE